MAVAASSDRFGMQEAEVTVAAPLVVELATPRFLSIGDSAVLALDVQNLAGSTQEVRISLSKPGWPVDQGRRRAVFAQGSAETHPAHSDRSRQRHRSDRAAGAHRQPAAPDQAQLPAPGAGADAAAVGGAATGRRPRRNGRHCARPNSAACCATASRRRWLSDKAPIDVRSAVQGLLTYPYGCAEQTTSSAYPHLFIDETAARQFGLKPFSKAQRAALLDKAIARLAGMQAPNGGFSLWGNRAEYQYWLSAYVANFLLDAREQGFDVPPEVERRAFEFLLKGLQEGIAGLPSGAVQLQPKTRSGATVATPARAASRCSPTALMSWPARAKRRWRRCASCTSHRPRRLRGCRWCISVWRSS
jgi:uncharacterized protein YfaS (alpha-2-macroglobulin family)